MKKWWFLLRKYIFFTLYTYTIFSLFPLKYNTNSAETRNYIKFRPVEFRERSLYPTAVCKSAKIAMSQKELSHKTTCSGGPRNFFSKIFEMEIKNLYWYQRAIEKKISKIFEVEIITFWKKLQWMNFFLYIYFFRIVALFNLPVLITACPQDSLRCVRFTT